MIRKSKSEPVDQEETIVTSQTAAAGQLRAFFERWQRLEEEKSTISEDLKEMFAEAKGTGFDTKAMRAVFRDKMKDQAELMETEAIYDLYWTALEPPPARPAHSARENIHEFPRAVKAKPADGGANITMTHTNIQAEVPHDPTTGEILDEPATVTIPEAKASDDNGGTSAIEGAPMTGEASRASVGAGTDAINSPEAANELLGGVAGACSGIKCGENRTGTESETSGDSLERQAPNSPAMASGRLSVATSSEPHGMEDAGGDSVERHATNSEIQERPSINDEASPEAGPQAEASLVGTDTGTLADREGRSEGEAASVDLPTNSEIAPDPRLPVGSDGDPSIPSPEAGGAKMDEVSASPDRAAQAVMTDANSGQAVTNSDAEVPAFLKTGLAKSIAALRPHCLNPSECAGYGKVHCHRCTTAHEAQS
ncbi:DUF2312 domain-containing protein [Mesorhizobium sp. M0028]